MMMDSPEPIIREAAINSFSSNNTVNLVNTLAPLLNDPVKIVRLAAAERLSAVQKDFFSGSQYIKLTEVRKEYLDALMYTSDFPAGKYNLGNYYSNEGDYLNAERFYNEAVKMDSLFYPAKSNLALLYYNQGKLQEAEKLFLDLIKNHSEYTQSEYYLGLLYAEQKRYEEAAEVLEKAASRADANPRIFYNLGLIYQYLDKKEKAESSLLKAYSSSPDEFDVIYALADFYIKQGEKKPALKYAEELKVKFPSKPDGSEMVNYINNL
jgi:tetratricopeptide (TPR) repeat protein